MSRRRRRRPWRIGCRRVELEGGGRKQRVPRVRGLGMGDGGWGKGLGKRTAEG